MSTAIAILSWRAPKTLRRTLESYKRKGLFECVDQRVIYFQEIGHSDRQIAEQYGLEVLGDESNVGIGRAFGRLARRCEAENILFLENDFLLIENRETTAKQLAEAEALLAQGIHAVKLRHRKRPGRPLYGKWFKGQEERSPTHLLDCVHWRKRPDRDFPELITRLPNEWYVASSSHASYTNNPTLYRHEWWCEQVAPFCEGNLEDGIQAWWQTQGFAVAQGKGLFQHRRRD